MEKNIIKPAFIDYNRLEDFYTIGEACALLCMEKEELKIKSEEMSITPSWNKNGEPGFTKNDFRNLHNKVYHEKHMEKAPAPKKIDRDPWG